MKPVLEIQRALLARGYDIGRAGADGDMGPDTLSAILKALDKLPLGAAVADPPWLSTARKYIGQKERAGPQHNANVLRWWKNMGTSFKDDETAWCGAFVGGVLIESDLKAAKNGASARAWNSYGTKLTKPAVGCIVVFWRGSKAGASGHVGFVVGKDQHGNLMVMGGNQGNAVSIKPFGKDRVLGYRWPGVYPREERFNLPVVNSDNKVSINEA